MGRVLVAVRFHTSSLGSRCMRNAMQITAPTLSHACLLAAHRGRKSGRCGTLICARRLHMIALCRCRVPPRAAAAAHMRRSRYHKRVASSVSPCTPPVPPVQVVMVLLGFPPPAPSAHSPTACRSSLGTIAGAEPIFKGSSCTATPGPPAARCARTRAARAGPQRGSATTSPLGLPCCSA